MPEIRRRSGRGAIDTLEATFLQLQIVAPDATIKKNALQRLCRLYRLGQRLRAPEAMTLLVLGLLYDGDKKVVRWALNAAAFLVRAEQVGAILDAIGRNPDDPDIIGAGVAALAATHDEDRLRELLSRRGLPLEGATLLAAAQKIPSLQGKLIANRVNIDTAEISELRLSGVLVGVDRAPENLFDENHPNSSIMGELNTHPDAVVAQYSIWATMESRTLGFAHLRIPLADVVAQPPNVRAYIYRLVAADAGAARANYDFIEEASLDIDADARAGLARGLRDTYFDGVEEIVISWILDEADLKVRGFLLEHMAAQSSRMDRYGDFVEQAYAGEATASVARARLEAASKGTPLASRLGRIRLLGENADLLRLGDAGVTNNFTFNAPATGAFSGSGTAQTGDISLLYQQQAPQIASEQLSALLDLLAADKKVSSDVTAEVLSAKNAPTKSKVQGVLDWFRVAKEGGQIATATIGAAPGIINQLTKVIPYLTG